MVGGGLLFSPFLSDTLAQEKKREKFGSSLKRLKWDKEKETAVDKESGKVAARSRANSTSDPDVIRIDTSLVTFDLLVTDRQGYVIKGLTKEDFVIKEDNVLQQTTIVSLGDDVALPRSIVLIIDESQSQTPYLETSLTAAKALVDQLRPNDKMAIVTDNVALLQDFTQEKSQLKAVLDTMKKNAFNPYAAPSLSLQYSALFSVLQELLIEAERPIIIFQTDGDQLPILRLNTEKWGDRIPRPRTNFSLNDIISAAQREHATVFSVIPGIQMMGFSPTEQVQHIQQVVEDWIKNGTVISPIWASIVNRRNDRKYLERPAQKMLRYQEALARLAAATGGWHDFLEHPEQAATIYERILKDINRRYIIGYYPSNDAQDGTLRKVHFEIRNHPEYVIVGRRSYYALQR